MALRAPGSDAKRKSSRPDRDRLQKWSLFVYQGDAFRRMLDKWNQESYLKD